MALADYDHFTAHAAIGRRITLIPGGPYGSDRNPATTDRYTLTVGTRIGGSGTQPSLDIEMAEVHALRDALTAAIDAHNPVPPGWAATTVERASTGYGTTPAAVTVRHPDQIHTATADITCPLAGTPGRHLARVCEDCDATIHAHLSRHQIDDRYHTGRITQDQYDAYLDFRTAINGGTPDPDASPTVRRIARKMLTVAADLAYLAGPMTGLPDYNAAGFAAAAEWVRAQGWTPVSPHDTNPDHPGDCPPGERHKGHPNACWYAAGVRVLLRCTRIVLLPGWEASIGAGLELAVAQGAGLPVVAMPALAAAAA